MNLVDRHRNRFRQFIGDRRGTSAVEFAIVSMPMILMLLMILQMGVYYMTKSSLDIGVIQAADSLVNTANADTAPNCTNLKANVATKSGGLVQNNSNLAVSLQQFVTLSAAVLPIVDGTCDTGTTTSVLELRAQSMVPVFVPGMGALAMVRSAALVRRQGY